MRRTTDYKINNTVFRVTYGDITQAEAEALVSSDDNYLTMGGGVSAAILRSGGKIIQTEARKHIPLQLGDVVVTSAGNLAARYIFHAVTIDYNNMVFASEDSVKQTALRCLQLSDTLGVRRIAFPALATGAAKFPFQLAAETITKSISDYLLGNTKLEVVILTLFAREGVRESDLDLFYEQAVALAAVASQSRRLGMLLSDLEQIVRGMNSPQMFKRVAELRNDLERAQISLAKNPEYFEEIENVSKRAILVTSEPKEIELWKDQQLEAEVLRTRLSGLLTQLNIQTANLNKYLIEKAKFGGQLIPIRLEHAIDDISKEIAETETRIRNARMQLTALGVA